MALPERSPLLPLDAYQRVMQQGTRDLVDHVHTLETAGKSSRAAKEALNSSLTTLKELHSYNDEWIEQNIPLEYKQGWDDAFKSSLYANPTGLGGAYGDRAFSMMHREAIETLAYNMRDNVDVALAQVGRQMADEFRQAGMDESLRRQFTGATIKQSTKSMVGELQGRGLTQFTDKAGRKWGLDNYCTMVARTTTREATTQGTLLRAKRLEHKLIHLSEHSPTCELCAPLQGRVYAMNEDDKRYPLWHDDYCPVHPNCLHTISVYIEKYDPNKEATLNKSNRPFEDSRSAAEKNAYKGMQRKNQKLSDLRNHHSRYVSRLGADKAGTIQGFARSKAANSARYKELQAAYRAAGARRSTSFDKQAALSRLNLLSGDSVYVDTPLPFAGRGSYGEVTSKMSNAGLTWQDGRFAEVNTNNIITTQATLERGKLEYFINNIDVKFEDLFDQIRVVKEGNSYYLIDGNHRVVASLLGGRTKMQAVVVDLP